MKHSFIHRALVASLLMTMVLGTLPLQAQSRDYCRRNRDAYRQQAYYQQPVYAQPTNYRTHRSLGKSVLIVGGSAAAGAAIGGLAGGGKGAGIGAIAGGLGGLIYDRATANHH